MGAVRRLVRTGAVPAPVAATGLAAACAGDLPSARRPSTGKPAAAGPGAARPGYAGPQPVRNLDLADPVELLLGLPPVPGGVAGTTTLRVS